ncbi:MAG: Maf family protein [Spirochaetes bacterium]|nr:Maf family protein [Spirochaetota bacterium]
MTIENFNNSDDTIILASTSPRRSEILKRLGVPFAAKPQDIDETVQKWKVPKSVKKLAKKKVKNALKDSSLKDFRWFLGADTVVVCNKKVFGKPASAEEAEEIIGFLSNKKHKVTTALAFFDKKSGKMVVKHNTTSVFFSKMTKKEIKQYVSTEEWQGAAGGYRIQGRGEFFVKRIKGSYSNVMGLPIHLFFAILSDAGYPVWS